MSALENKILEILKSYSSSAPLRREDLLIRLQDCGIDISDREMRRICSDDLPVLSNEKGYFLPKTKADILDFKNYLSKISFSLFKRYARAKNAYPELFCDQQQPDFFGGLK